MALSVLKAKTEHGHAVCTNEYLCCLFPELMLVSDFFFVVDGITFLLRINC